MKIAELDFRRIPSPSRNCTHSHFYSKVSDIIIFSYFEAVLKDVKVIKCIAFIEIQRDFYISVIVGLDDEIDCDIILYLLVTYCYGSFLHT